MRPDHDVVIVGGGPAGLSTALHLAHHDRSLRGRMVVLERHRYPRDKPCAGALGARAERALAKIGVEVDVPSARVAGISVALGRGTVAHRTGEIGRVVRRAEFDARLGELARARGIAVREEVKVTGIEPGPCGVRVSTARGDLYARVVIGADGVESVVRKELGFAPGVWRARVIEADTEPAPNDDPGLLHFDLSDAQFSGYEWDFPTPGTRLVCRGVYQLVLPGRSPIDLDARLSARLARAGLPEGACVRKRYAERGFSRHEPASCPRVLLVGEAAGVDPITGEGIAQSLLYGAVAAPYLAARLAAGKLAFDDWPRHLGRSTLGIDLRLRHSLCRRIFGPSRDFYERALNEMPLLLACGTEYFGGRRVSRTALGRLGAAIATRLWRERASGPLRPLAHAGPPG